MRTEVLWDHAIAPFWGAQAGVRHDTGGGSRSWLAFGVQGLAPYWFETEATVYWGNGGTFAARVDLKYERLFTQRLVLQPEFATNLYSREDRAFGNGAGLSDLRVDLRLRYELRRQFAPYIGVSWHRKVGGTARLAEQQGKERQTVEAVAGVRFWF
jgi:copper resistance protein B